MSITGSTGPDRASGAGPVQDTVEAGASAAPAAHDHAAAAAERPGIGVSGEVGAAGLRARVEAMLGEVAAPASAHPELKLGDTGPEVRDFQSLLNMFGAVSIDVDGEFGPQTEAAVRAEQQARGLPVSGIADAATWKVLEDELA